MALKTGMKSGAAKYIYLQKLWVLKTSGAGKSIKRKHVPQRTCVGCREVLPKRSLIRIVRHPDGVQVDPTGKMAGRGAYLHNLHSCWEIALKGSLARSLKVELNEEERSRLAAFADTLVDEEI